MQELEFEPDFAKGNGLLPVITQDVHSNEVLMLAYMNKEAFERSLATNEAHYFSRSRNELWHKGASSGHIQKIHSIRLDCDSDTILLKVEQLGNIACHNGYKSCFYREYKNNEISLCFEQLKKPEEIYKK